MNTAGILRAGPLDSVTLADWQAMLAVNLNGCLLTAQAFGAQMAAKGAGASGSWASKRTSPPPTR